MTRLRIASIAKTRLTFFASPKCNELMMEPRQVMVWKVHEESSDEDSVKAWTLYIVKEGESPDQRTMPFARGYWFFGKEGRDPAGHRLYRAAILRAEAEINRLNAQPFVDGE